MRTRNIVWSLPVLFTIATLGVTPLVISCTSCYITTNSLLQTQPHGSLASSWAQEFLKNLQQKKKTKMGCKSVHESIGSEMKFQMSFEVYETPRENTIYFISNSSNCLVTDFSGAHKAPSPTLSVKISRFSRSA